MIRPATTADLAACLALGAAAFALDEDKPQAQWLVETLARPGAALTVCTEPFRPCAFLLTYPSVTRDRRDRTMVAMIATSAECRRAGVAKALLSTVGAPACTWIRSDNEPSQALFRSCGWVRLWDGDGWDWWELAARPNAQRGAAA